MNVIRDVQVFRRSYLEAPTQHNRARQLKNDHSCEIPPNLPSTIKRSVDAMLALPPIINLVYRINIARAVVNGTHQLFSAWSSAHPHIVKPPSSLTTWRKLIRDHTVDPAALNAEGEIILHTLCSQGEGMAVQALIELGADVNHRDHDGNTLTYLALKNANDTNLCLRLLDWGADINALHIDGGIETLFTYANRLFTKDGDGTLLRELLQRGVAPPKGTRDHFEGLRLVYENPSWFDQSIIWNRLVEAGWDINARSDDGKTLLFLAKEGQNWALFQKLIEHGARVDTLAPNGERLVSWEQLHDNREFWKDLLGSDPLPPPTRRGFFNKIINRSSPNSKAKIISSIIDFCKKNETNPLKTVFFFGDDTLIQELSGQLTFWEFCNALAQMKHEHPHLQIDWLLNTLYDIAPEHYSNFEEIETGLDELPPLTEPLDLAQLEELFSNVNFSNPALPHYRSESHCTFEGKVYSIPKLKSCIATIVKTITHRLPDIAAPSPVEKPEAFEAYYAKLEHYLSHVILQLQNGEAHPATKTNVLIDLAYGGLKCTDKWKELFYQAHCRLRGTKENLLTLPEEVIKSFGDDRSAIVQHLSSQIDYIDVTYGTHAYHALLYALQDARAIPGEKQPKPDKFVDPDIKMAFDAFDDINRPHHLITHLVDLQRSSPEFREKLHGWFSDNLAPLWLDEPFREIVAKAEQCGPDQLIATKEQFAEFFNELFPDEILPRPATVGWIIDFIRREAIRCLATSFDEDAEKFLLQEGVNPIAVAHMLVLLGDLKYRNPNSFAKSFEKITPIL